MNAEELNKLENAAAAGDMNAYYLLGVAYDQGDGVERDAARAAQYFQSAVNMGHVDAMNNLGVMTLKGDGVPKNAPIAVRLLGAAADGGNAQALYNLGVIYHNGIGVPKDPKQARTCMTLAMKAGHPQAEQELAEMTAAEKISGTPNVISKQSPPSAVAEEEQPVLPREKMDMKNIAVALILVLFLIFLFAGTAGPILAGKWNGRHDGAIMGQVNTAANLRKELQFEDAKKILDDLAEKYPKFESKWSAEEGRLNEWIKLDARKTELEKTISSSGTVGQALELLSIYRTLQLRSLAQSLLKNMSGTPGLPQETLRAVAKECALNGLVQLQIDTLNRCVQTYPWDMIALSELSSAVGFPLSAGQKEVLEFQRDAEGGDTIGQYNYGWAIYTGHVVATNQKAAVKWFRLAASSGYAPAQNYMGVIFKNGEGLPVNLPEAKKWFKLAADQGDAYGQANTADLLTDENIANSDVLALDFAQKSASQGNAFAQYLLGWMYETGRGTPANKSEAARFYKQSASQGNEAARKSLSNLGYN